MVRLQQDWGRFLPPFGDLLHRNRFAQAFAGQVVCVAGAGGYIGSALVRALARGGVGSLILIDSSEFGLFEMQRYLEAEYPAVPSESILGSVADVRLIDNVFKPFRPQAVFHAAAFKHVGLLEQNPFAAIENNSVASYALAQAALRHGVSKLLLVSTDKAARPHSVMGVSKRIAEILTLSLSARGLQANAIRLGNVIGSTGSVVPIFWDCIAKGQPLCVTHAEATRYFLSRDEAVTAILAAAIADLTGKLLLPHLAAPVCIADLAKFLLTVKPNTSEICFTGLKAGEKMTEDLVGPQETQIGTIDGPLTVWDTQRLEGTECDEVVQRLSGCVANRDRARLVDTLRAIVPEYVPSVLMQESAAVVS